MANNGSGSVGLSSDIATRWLALSEEIRRRLGTGTAADATSRAALERQSGLHVDSAMVHAGSMGRALASELGAEAFSLGHHVVGPQELSQSTDPRGAALLAHELSHVATASTGAGPGAGHDVQREPDHEMHEMIAQRAEADSLQGDSLAGPASTPVRSPSMRKPTREEVDVVTDLVYGRLVREVSLEQERSGRPSAGFAPGGHRG